MGKRTIRVLVVDRAGADYHHIQKSLTQCGVLTYVVERAGNLVEALEMLADDRYDCCFVEAEMVSSEAMEPKLATLAIAQRPLIFVVNHHGSFAPPPCLTRLEAMRLSRNNMTVPHLLMAIRQAVRANAALRKARQTKTTVGLFPKGGWRPAFPM